MPRPTRSRAAALRSRESSRRAAEAGVDGEGSDVSYQDDAGQNLDENSEVSDDDSDGSDGSNFEVVASGRRRRGRGVRGTGGAGFEPQTEQGRPEAALASAAAASAPPPAPRDVYKIPAYPQDSRRTRLYAGPLKKWDRYRSLIEILYGPDPESIGIVDKLRHHWAGYPVLPRKTVYHRRQADGKGGEDGGEEGDEADEADKQLGGVLPSPWVSNSFEAEQAAAFRSWHAELGGSEEEQQQTAAVSPERGRQSVPVEAGDLVVLLGPASNQQAVRFSPGSCLALEADGLPYRDEDETGPDPTERGGERENAGWMLDAGGIVVAMAWAPLTGRVDQLLAVAAVPYATQEPAELGGNDGAEQHQYQHQQAKPLGSIQLWRVALETSRRQPRLADPVLERVLLFDWGQPKRMQWCPVPLEGGRGLDSQVCGLLAILTGDGMVRVVEVGRNAVEGRQTEYEYINQPVATFGLPDEYNVTVTCLSWLGVNRLVLGHSDGSLSLWSVRPRQLLQRHPVHSTQVLDVCSGYPSYPYMVASHPVGGLARLVDLARPSSEHTFHPSPMVTFQPGLLQWCDHMLGFAAAAPSNNPRNGSLDYLHVRFYPGSRTFFPGRGLAPPMCLSVGAAHPFVLVGRADGSLWACNMMQKVFRNRSDVSYRLKIFEAEFRPPPAGDGNGVSDGDGSQGGRPLIRGAVRILQGFEPDRNELPAPQLQAVAKTAAGTENSDDSNNDDSEGDGDGPGSDTEQGPGQAVIYDPLTRISAVAWNCNVEYGWWAAVGMASGLIRILDLGVEPEER